MGLMKNDLGRKNNVYKSSNGFVKNYKKMF